MQYKIKQPIIRDDGVWSNGYDDGEPDFQQCNADEYVISGGGQCQWPSVTFLSVPRFEWNGWSHDCTGGGNSSSAHAFAVCMKRQ